MRQNEAFVDNPCFEEQLVDLYTKMALDERSDDWLRLRAIEWKQELMLDEEELYEETYTG